MYSAFLLYKSSTVHYTYSGNGHKVVLCFHGYNGSSYSFSFLKNVLPPEYSLLAIDLPYHGKTLWNEGLLFTPADLIEIIEKICNDHFPGTQNFFLLGFSMGGRVALGLLQSIPEKIERLILLAPDGLKVNGWYSLATQTVMGNKLFDFTMNNPQWFFKLIRLANSSGMINQSLLKFTEYHIHNKTVRRQLYQSWTCMRKFKPHLGQIKRSITKYGIQTRLIYGQYDRIILQGRGLAFQKGIESNCNLIILDCGHQVLQPKNASAIVNALHL